MGITELLLAAFIVLKLLKIITWSWWLVLSPLWVMVGIYLIIFIIAYIKIKK